MERFRMTRGYEVAVRWTPDEANLAASAQSSIDTDGFVYINRIPDGYEHLSLLRKLGTPLPQYHGSIVREVRPDPAMEQYAVSSLNTKALTPHTEHFEFAGLPPRLIALWAVRPAIGAGGETTLADGHRLMERFSPRERAQMAERVYEWSSPASLSTEGISIGAQHPIIEHTEKAPVIRFSSREMRYRGEAGIYEDDELLERYRETGISFFEETCLAVKIEQNALLVWDNWRMLHSRTSFSDSRRHLRRVMLGEAGIPHGN